LAGVTYNIFDPDICKYAMYVYLNFGERKYDKEYITNAVRKLVADFFSEVQSDVFIPKSDIIQLLKNNISELDGVDVYFLSEKNETAIETGRYVKTEYSYDLSTGLYNKEKHTIHLYDGEDPHIGLDAHGNIYLEANSQFPVLMGGWKYYDDKNNAFIQITDPLTIIVEE
jgi:hypothetical protein